MYKNNHKNANEYSNNNYWNDHPFEKSVEIDRKRLLLTSAIEQAKDKGANPVIAEIKYRSPTTNFKNPSTPEDLARQMLKGGACAISTLTEPEFFGGSLEYLRRVKKSSQSHPVLRKDFVFDKHQIPESYYYGADSLLLISSFFTEKELRKMIALSRSYGMEPLVEVHNKKDINLATSAGAALFAINNRDKDTLKIDLRRTKRLAPTIKGTKVSASGIETTEHLKEVLKYSDAALIGSSRMAAEDIEKKVADFVTR